MKTSTILVLAFVAYLVVNAAQKSVNKVADTKASAINGAIRGGVDLGKSVIDALFGHSHTSSGGVAHNTGSGSGIVGSTSGHSIDYGGGDLPDDFDPSAATDPDDLVAPDWDSDE